MIDRFIKKKSVIILILSLFIISIFTSLYFMYIVPLRNNIDMRESELANEKKLVETLTLQTQSAPIGFETTTELQKKLPVKPLSDQFIRDLEKAEISSNSIIDSISIADGDFQPVEDSGSEEEATELAPDESEATDDASTETVPQPPIYEGLKKLTATLSVTSPSYKELELFLTSLSSMPRIMNIDMISFAGNDEITTLDDEISSIKYTIVVSTFYYPKLTELSKELPIISVEPPSNKKDPFYNNEKEQE